MIVAGDVALDIAGVGPDIVDVAEDVVGELVGIAEGIGGVAVRRRADSSEKVVGGCFAGRCY